MSGEITRWLASTPAERDRNRAVQHVQARTDVAQAVIAGVGQVSQSAMFGALSLGMMKREASLLVPEDAAKFDLIATQAAMGMAGQIQRVAGY
jgi:hypothetical protein